MTEPLTWRNVSTPNLRDFLGYDGERAVARIYQVSHGDHQWRWSVYAVEPARPSITHGYESDPKEARRKVEECWAYAKANGRPIRTAVAEHVWVETWTNARNPGSRA